MRGSLVVDALHAVIHRNLKVRTVLLSEAIAARIIELARTGERDPEKLCDFAIAALKTPPALEREDV